MRKNSIFTGLIGEGLKDNYTTQTVHIKKCVEI